MTVKLEPERSRQILEELEPEPPENSNFGAGGRAGGRAGAAKRGRLRNTASRKKPKLLTEISTKKEKWFATSLLKSRQNKLKLQKLFFDEPSEIYKQNFKKYRLIYNKTCHLAKKMYYCIVTNFRKPRLT